MTTIASNFLFTNLYLVLLRWNLCTLTLSDMTLSLNLGVCQSLTVKLTVNDWQTEIFKLSKHSITSTTKMGSACNNTSETDVEPWCYKRDGWWDWSLGGVRYRALYGANNHQDHSHNHNHHTHGRLYDDDGHQVMCPTKYKTRSGQAVVSVRVYAPSEKSS